MAIMKTRYSSHLQLQYLLHRMAINQQRLLRDLHRYYDRSIWDLKVTPTGKVTAAKLRSGCQRPVFNNARRTVRGPGSASKPAPTVRIRRRRIIGVRNDSQ